MRADGDIAQCSKQLNKYPAASFGVFLGRINTDAVAYP